MKRLIIGVLLIASASYSFGQYCNTGGPTSGIDSNLESLTLFGATGSISYTGCPGVLGVEEYLTSTAYLDAGQSYSMNLQFGTCGNSFSGAGEAWIDFNLDGTFDPTESIGTWTGIPPTAASVFNFTVPAGATTGQSRMRVIQQENGSIPLDPCASFAWGSVTDFSIFIQNGVDCSTYIGDDFSDPRMVMTLPYSENYDNSFCYSNQNIVYNSPDVFYLITGLANIGHINVSLCGSSFDTFLSIADSEGNIIAINDDYNGCGTQSELFIDTEGHDSLFVIVEGWGANTGSYSINIEESSLAINQLEADAFTIYPNPAKTSFSIGNNYSGLIEIINSEGKVIHSKTISAQEKVNITSIESGLYYLAFQSGDKRIIKKLIIN